MNENFSRRKFCSLLSAAMMPYCAGYANAQTSVGEGVFMLKQPFLPDRRATRILVHHIGWVASPSSYTEYLAFRSWAKDQSDRLEFSSHFMSLGGVESSFHQQVCYAAKLEYKDKSDPYIDALYELCVTRKAKFTDTASLLSAFERYQPDLLRGMAKAAGHLGSFSNVSECKRIQDLCTRSGIKQVPLTIVGGRAAFKSTNTARQYLVTLLNGAVETYRK